MTSGLIASQSDLEDLCDHIRAAGRVAFDTEFVSEHTFRPELCLLQFATTDRCVGVDPFEVESLQPWWDIMADESTEVIVHGGQAEIKFCLELGSCRPRNLIDVQLAEGFRSRSYPLGHSALVQRVLGKHVHGKEARTDWRVRPLSADQTKYALDDVRYVLAVWETQRTWLEKHGRGEWVAAECDHLVAHLASELTQPPWVKLSGVHRLSRTELAVAAAITEWRLSVANSTNRPIRRVLRDDIVLDLARRQPKNEKALMAMRDMNRRDYRRHADEIMTAIKAGLAVPADQRPTPPENTAQEKNKDEQVIGQLLGIALANRCAEVNIARPLIGTTADLRHLVRWHVYGHRSGPKPKLAEGWRGEVCGDLLTDVLDGKIAMRVADVNSDHPLIFERVEEKE